MLAAVAVEVGEATLELVAFDIVGAGGAARERVGLVLGRRHCLGVDVAVLVRRLTTVVCDAEGVPRATAVDAEHAIVTGQLDGFATMAHLDVIWFWG